MNKKILNRFLLALVATGTHLGLFGDCCSKNYFEGLSQGVQAEFRVAYFSPESKKFRKIYSSNLVDYQIEISKRFYNDWDIWLDVDYMSKKGHSTYFRDKTKITIVPIALGVSYNVAICEDSNAVVGPGASVYLGAGVNYSYLHLHDLSYYVRQHTSKWDVGGTFKLGFKKEFCEGLVLDLFVDYFLQHFQSSRHNHYSYYVERHHFDASGVKIGAGIGYKF